MVTHFYEPRLGHRLPHDPINAIVAPRPIGWISSISPQGRVNLAPYSHFNAFNDAPPILAFGCAREKDTLRNVRATGEFVWNLATRPLAEAMNVSSADFDYGEDEMAHAGLEKAASTLVRPPRVAAAAAAMECRLIDILPLRDSGGNALRSFMVLGEVVGVHIDPGLLNNGLFDTAAAQPLARCGYRGDYAVVTSLFDMVRPSTPPRAPASPDDR